MRTFLAMVGFEIGYYLRRISTWAYFGIFLALGILLMALLGGVWASVSAAVAGGSGTVYVNSPFTVMAVVSSLSIFGVLVTAALLGDSSHRDYETGMYHLFFSSPVGRFSYLGGRFLGALIVNALVLIGIPLGALLGSLLPMLDPERLGPTRLAVYAQPYLVFVLPTLVFTGAIFFALAASTRKMLPNYVGGAILIVGYLLAGQLTADMENRVAAALIDPFGGEAATEATRYWTPAQRNTELLGFEGMVLWNRLLWVGIGIAIFAAVFARFRFSHETRPLLGRRRRARAEEEERRARPASVPGTLALPAVTRGFGFDAHLRQYLSITVQAFRGVVLNRYFLGILAAGLAFLVVGATQADTLYGTQTWPVTYLIIDVLGGLFSLFVLIVIVFYAGELIWRERDLKLQQIYDTAPLPNWVVFAGKLTALVGVVAMLQLVILLAGVVTQAVKGYYQFELGLYLRMLFGAMLVEYVLLCFLVMLVHVLVNNKYMGHMIAVLYFVLTMFAAQLGLEHNLYMYGATPGIVYSDMNRFGPFLEPYAWFSLYWAAWALLLAVLANLFWPRGLESGARWRLRLARLRFERPALAGVALATVLIATLGGFIFYNTNVLNDYRTSFGRQALQADYEKLYRRHLEAPQPRIVAVDLHVELYPEARDVELRGEYWLRNQTPQPLDSLHLIIPVQVIDVGSVAMSVPAERVLTDDRIGYYIYRLARPLAPGDSMRMEFSLALDTEGFGNTVENLEVVENGTFFNSGVLPRIGYDESRELSDDETRRKHDLAPRPRMRRIDDPLGLRNSYISSDADWVRFAATIGTVPDQIAVAPGYLTREWTEGDRRYFRYEMDAPILGFFSVLSARYAVARDAWTDSSAVPARIVAIEVYHHPTHTFNIDRMIQATKASLDYFTAAFGPYQHRQVRILEFPRYAAFAQSFPNTIPYSEAIGFIARVGEDDIDYPFYVTAHEVAHQWWAHQVIGAAVQGSTVLVETLAQYSALMVMEREYGREKIGRFMEYELDRYLSGRAFERRKELPLLYNENQPYIHYNKGAVVMYALRDLIGEERLNQTLARFIRDKAYTGPPYPTSEDLYAYLEEATPDSLHTLLDEFFRKITLWDLRAQEATAERLADGQYRVTMRVEARKVYADSLGNEAEVQMADPIDIGIFGESPSGDPADAPILYLRKHPVRSGEQVVTVTVPGVPARAGVDPHHKLIDLVVDDNTTRVAVQ